MKQLIDYDAYRKWKQKYDQAESRVNSLESEITRIPHVIEGLRDDLADATADAELEGHDPDEDETVQELREKLRAKRRRKEEVEDDLKSARRVVERLGRNENQAVSEARKEAKDEMLPEVAEALSDAQDALSNFREARDRLDSLVKKWRVVDEKANLFMCKRDRLVPEAPDVEEWEMQASEFLEGAEVTA
jgi:chromosome segregation ATPase